MAMMLLMTKTTMNRLLTNNRD